jgi:integrase
VMNWAKSMGYVDRNPIEGMPKPSAHVRQDFLPPDTWSKVLELATDQPFRDYLTVMFSSGARPVEMGKFEACQLNGNRLILPIEKSKGKKRSRVVYLPDDALQIVLRLAKTYPIGPLFRNSAGNPWNKDSIRCRFRRLKRELKMPTLTPTTLRHSFAHYRLSSGQDALTVAKLLGHVDTRMVATRYGHLEANVEYMTAAANGVSFPSPLATSPNPVD